MMVLSGNIQLVRQTPVLPSMAPQFGEVNPERQTVNTVHASTAPVLTGCELQRRALFGFSRSMAWPMSKNMFCVCAIKSKD
jgi:hypothetical protein